MKYILFLLFFIVFIPRVSSVQASDTCAYAFQSNKPIEQSPQSLDSLTCEQLDNLAKGFSDNMLYRKEYDTLKYAMERCAMEPNYWLNFNSISGACFMMGGAPERYDTCREWLKKVLYYNTIDSNYYCADAYAIANTFGYFPGRGFDIFGTIAVLRYVKESGKCNSWHFVKNFTTDSIEAMKQALYIWRDSVQDSIKTPFDPVIPTIDDLNLGILRGPSGVVSQTRDYRLGELIAVRNPFTDALNLKYKLIRNGMVRIEVLDILGRSIYSEGQGYKPEGEHTLTIQTHNWSSGSYYVRLSTPSGEIKTVKVIKE